MGSDATPKWGINYPASTDPTNVPGDIGQPMTEIDALLAPVVAGTLSGRPAAGKQGRWYQATDGGNYGYIFQDTGTTWLAIGAINSTYNSGVGSVGLLTSSTPGNPAAQGASPLAAAADHGHAVPGWGSAANIAFIEATASAGTTGKFADAGHVHAGGQVGDVTWSLASTPAADQVIANGQVLSQATYPALYALASAQGWPQNSPGSGNFNVIDLRGQSPIGAGLSYAVGQFYGASTTTLSLANLPTHNHGTTDPGHYHFVNDSGHYHGLSSDGGGQFVVTWNEPPYTMGTGGQQVTYTNGSTTVAGTGITLQGAYTGLTVNNAGSSAPFSNLSPVVGLTPFVKSL